LGLRRDRRFQFLDPVAEYKRSLEEGLHHVDHRAQLAGTGSPCPVSGSASGVDEYFQNIVLIDADFPSPPSLSSFWLNVSVGSTPRNSDERFRA